MSTKQPTKKILYKGVKMVPAKELKIGEGKVKLVPVKTDRYTLYGIPMPNGIELTDEIKGIATGIIALNKAGVNKKEPVLIRYIRKGRDGYVLASSTIKDTREYFVAKGEPYGVVVAFLYEGNMRIGWSKRLEGEKFVYGRKVQREPLSFTKKDAVNIAVIRGLVDSLTFRGSGIFTIGNDVIPKTIAKILPDFIKKAEKYFRCDAMNVIQSDVESVDQSDVKSVDQSDVEKECPPLNENVGAA